MLVGNVGSPALIGDNYRKDPYTHINSKSGASANASGYLVTADIYTHGATTATIKVFRDNGTHYVYIGGETFSLSSGLVSVTFTSLIPIQIGDYIGFYDNAVGIRVTQGVVGNEQIYDSGNIVTNTLKTAWLSDFFYPSIYGYIDDGRGTRNGSFFIFL